MIKGAIKRFSNLHRPNGSPDVYLFSTPRSGSTWVMELIWSQPGFKYCKEPFNLREPSVRHHLGIDSWPTLYEPESEPQIASYLTGISRGALQFKNPNPLRSYYRPISNRVVFKVLHGCEDRINWIRDNLNARIVYLLRHPIAVALSRKALPRLTAFLNSPYQLHFSAEQLSEAQKIVEKGSQLEQGVLSWCLQNSVPLKSSHDKWAIVTYEQLILEPNTIIDYLVDVLQLSHPERIYKQLKIPSGVIQKSDTETAEFLTQATEDRSWLISKWQKKVHASEEATLMDILHLFDLDIYRNGHLKPSHDVWITRS